VFPFSQQPSLDSVLFAKRLSILPDHAHFFSTETCVLDSHAEKRVFVFLIVGSKRVIFITASLWDGE